MSSVNDLTGKARLAAVRRVLKGAKTAAVAAELGACATTIREWRRRFERHGVNDPLFVDRAKPRPRPRAMDYLDVIRERFLAGGAAPEIADELSVNERSVQLWLQRHFDDDLEVQQELERRRARRGVSSKQKREKVANEAPRQRPLDAVVGVVRATNRQAQMRLVDTGDGDVRLIVAVDGVQESYAARDVGSWALRVLTRLSGLTKR